jgi:hypothetical protein
MIILLLLIFGLEFLELGYTLLASNTPLSSP